MDDAPAPSPTSQDHSAATSGSWLRGAVIGGMIGAILGLLREADSSVGPLPAGLGMAAIATFGFGLAAIVGVIALLSSNRRAGVGLLATALAGFAVFKVLELVVNAI